MQTPKYLATNIASIRWNICKSVFNVSQDSTLEKDHLKSNKRQVLLCFAMRWSRGRLFSGAVNLFTKSTKLTVSLEKSSHEHHNNLTRTGWYCLLGNMWEIFQKRFQIFHRIMWECKNYYPHYMYCDRPADRTMNRSVLTVSCSLFPPYTPGVLINYDLLCFLPAATGTAKHKCEKSTMGDMEEVLYESRTRCVSVCLCVKRVMEVWQKYSEKR